MAEMTRVEREIIEKLANIDGTLELLARKLSDIDDRLDFIGDAIKQGIEYIVRQWKENKD